MDVLNAVLIAFGVFVLGYFLVVNATYAVVHLVALRELKAAIEARTLQEPYPEFGSPFLPGVAVVVPAYDEAPVIVDSVRSFLDLEYPDCEVIVVNDGSEDATLERLVEAFDLERIEASPPWELPSEPVNAIYRSPWADLTVIDKENGGKADALNAGVFFTEKPLFCAVDADSVIERDALMSVAQPFLEEPERTVATGGVVRVANGCSISSGIVERIALSHHPLVGVQTVEYLRAFLAGRMGLSRLDSLLIISGAFGMFDTETVREVGGYRTDSVTEDMELVVRLHRRLSEWGREYRVVFLPEPVVWTEVPETAAAFSRQRRRWNRGLFDTLFEHRDMIGNPKYGATGTFALPFFLVVEAFGPLVEGAGYVAIPIAVLLGVVNVEFFLIFLLLAMAFGTLLSWLGVLSELIGYGRYERPSEIARLLLYGVLENVLYRQWRTLVLWRGFLEFLWGAESWGTMERVGFDRDR
ncbi:glycosyltransferase family 2 protein [Halalkalicoccus ordinarius]|uniref:glycosyltransferase family 2 protein n=1 Tax=Halalkalicoccus ordinarius TaxID=3116651 RepID=UPI00300EB8B7